MRRRNWRLIRPVSCRAVAFHGMLAVAAWGIVPAGAQETVAPPAIYPADTWQGRTVATVRVLDTLDSSVQVLTIPVGQDATFRALTIHVGACRDRPATLVPDAAGWLAVRDTRQDGPGFNGWMMAGEPFLGVFQDPVYAVHLVGCSGDLVAPVPPPLAALAAATTQPADQPVETQALTPQGADAPVSAGATAGPQPLTVPPGAPPAVSVPRAAAAPLGGAPLSLSPPDETGPVATPAPQPPGAVVPPMAPGRPMPLPPPVPFATGGTAAPSRPPAPVAAPASQAQPGQPQSLLPP